MTDAPDVGPAIPAYLVAQDRWLLWRSVQRTNAKTGEITYTKVPLAYQDPRRPCASHDPRNWTSYDKVAAAIRRTPGAWDGPGFALGLIKALGEVVFGCDYDACVNPDGTLSAWAIPFVLALPSYHELSPSLAGIKGFGRLRLADLPEACRLLDIAEGDRAQARTRAFGERVNGQHAPSVQMFLKARFFTVTGRHWLSSVEDVTLLSLDQVAELARLFGPRPVSRSHASRPQAEDGDEPPDEAALRDKLGTAFLRNLRLKERWQGGTRGLNDVTRSGRDMSIVAMLVSAGFTKGETRAALRLFEHGKLANESPRYFEQMWSRTVAAPHPEPEPPPDWGDRFPPHDDPEDSAAAAEPEAVQWGDSEPVPEEPDDDAADTEGKGKGKAPPRLTDDEIEAEIAHLADLSPAAYLSQRRAAAKLLRFPPGELDRLVKAARAAKVRAASRPAAPATDTPEVRALIAEFNSKYFVLNENGKSIIYAPKHDPILNRRFFERIGFVDLERLYLNRIVKIGEKAGIPVFAPVAHVWLHHRHRKQYVGGVVFDPSRRKHPADVLNLWQGFAVTPRPGSWALLREHTRAIICNGNTELFDYLLDWLADLVQNPAKQAEVAIVMRGGEGTGKGILARAVKYLLGQHGFAISNSKHLTGAFNAHLRDCVLLFADEALYAGDKAHVGILKSIVTEPYLTIEGKYQNAVMSPNYLHLMLASNEQWVVPASLESRRFFVLDVGSDRANDHAYFGAIQDELEHGGYEAMLDELLNRIPFGNLRRIPITEALIAQRKLSLGIIESWWLDCLHRGYVFRSKLGLEHHFAQWHTEIATELLFDSYIEYCRAHRERRPLSREQFGAWLRTMGCKPIRPRGKVAVGEHITDAVMNTGHTSRIAELVKLDRARCYHLGSLELTREAFTKNTGLTVYWDEDTD